MLSDDLIYRIYDRSFMLQGSTCSYSENTGASEEEVLNNYKLVAQSQNAITVCVCNQVRGGDVVVLNEPWTYATRPLADAIITAKRSIVIGVLTADCVPVILYDESNQVIATIHCGWQGVLSSIIGNTLKKFKELSDGRVFAIIGPSIQVESYEVGGELRDDFVRYDFEAGRFFYEAGDFSQSGKFYFDLSGFVRYQLLSHGVEVVQAIMDDVFIRQDRYFSHRWHTKNGTKRTGAILSTVSLRA